MNAGVWTSIARITFSLLVLKTRRATISQPRRWAERALWRAARPFKGSVNRVPHPNATRTSECYPPRCIRHTFANIVRQIASPLAAVWTSINYVSFLWWSHSVRIAANESRNDVWNARIQFHHQLDVRTSARHTGRKVFQTGFQSLGPGSGVSLSPTCKWTRRKNSDGARWEFHWGPENSHPPKVLFRRLINMWENNRLERSGCFNQGDQSQDLDFWIINFVIKTISVC